MLNAEDLPIVRFVDHVLEHAVRQGASDVHFETFLDHFSIRFRVDGILSEQLTPNVHLSEAIIARLKTLANLDLAEKRLPQDGHLECVTHGRTIDFRISVLPTQYGESVVLRVLDSGIGQRSLAQMGITPAILASFRQALTSGSGMILTTGPTGSGKTTTLYGALRELNQEDTKIVTVEDPVEYETEGLVQVNIDDDIGLTFEHVLRAFLRHDPDKILIGELRDTVTAKIAVQAALTGHLVLSSLHTNDAPGAITRLIDMSVEPYLVADTLRGVLAQRLLRKICPHCKEAIAPTAEMRAVMEAHQIERTYRGRGCDRCDGSGYCGRFGVYEWLSMTYPLREATRQLRPLEELRAIARTEGLIPLKNAAAQHVNAGTTTLDEFQKL
ncbi:MAG: GspE/PulE family protein [Opitutales bacterium]|nr:GspE/PulE family protein [Opitutales bacterium]